MKTLKFYFCPGEKTLVTQLQDILSLVGANLEAHLVETEVFSPLEQMFDGGRPGEICDRVNMGSSLGSNLGVAKIFSHGQADIENGKIPALSWQVAEKLLNQGPTPPATPLLLVLGEKQRPPDRWPGSSLKLGKNDAQLLALLGSSGQSGEITWVRALAGGVGCSLVATALAWSLNIRVGKKTVQNTPIVLVDAAEGANLALNLGIKTDPWQPEETESGDSFDESFNEKGGTPLAEHTLKQLPTWRGIKILDLQGLGGEQKSRLLRALVNAGARIVVDLGVGAPLWKLDFGREIWVFGSDLRSVIAWDRLGCARPQAHLLGLGRGMAARKIQAFLAADPLASCRLLPLPVSTLVQIRENGLAAFKPRSRWWKGFQQWAKEVT